MESELPAQISELIDDFEHEWRDSDNERFASSYPDLAASFSVNEEDHEDVEMDQILKRTQRSRIADSSGADGA